VLHRPIETAGVIGVWHVAAASHVGLISSLPKCVHFWTDIPGSRIQYCAA
jgi:hypothetical protein